MIDGHIIKQKKIEQRLKAVFTAKRPAGSPVKEQKPAFLPEDQEPGALNPVSDVNSFPENPEDWQIREFFEQEIRSRLDEGINASMASYRLYQAADMAIDGSLISQMQIPLGLLAQGYIDVQACHGEIKKLSEETAASLFEYDASKRPIKVNIPKLTEISHNLVKSFITRRIAAVTTPIRQRFPLAKYESRDPSLVGQLKADMMTQMFESMADAYGYRPALEQTGRDTALYGHQFEFVAAPWDRKTTLLRRRKPDNGTAGIGAESTDYETVEVVEREGVDFVAPHPSRVFWDRIRPLRKFNTDTGGEYIGYWDVTRIGSLRRNRELWNRESVEWDTGLWDLMSQNQSYFRFYYREAIAVAQNFSSRPGLANDRLNNIEKYYQATDDAPVTIAYYYRRLNPKEWGIADYDHDLWVRFVVAGKDTVIWADVLGSLPGVYYGYNESDQRDISSTFAHDCMQFQDQVSNLLSQLLDIQYQGLMRMYALNVDGMAKEEIDKVEAALHSRNLAQAQAIIIKFSAQAMNDMGMDARTQHQERLRAIEVSTTEKTTEVFRSIMNLLALAERQLFFSPQEMGQVAPREITATEATMVNNTTLGIRDFHSIGIEEGLDTKKRIVYESSIAFGSDEIELPVVGTYSVDTIRAAGFTVISSDEEGAQGENVRLAKSGRFSVSGHKHDLVANYMFTSRDGSERAPDKEIANAIVQLVGVIGQTPALGKVITLGQGVELIQTVARKLGVPTTLRLPAGMDPNSPMDDQGQAQMQQFAQGVQQAIQALAQEVQTTKASQQALAESLRVLAEAVQKVATQRGQIAPGVPRGTGAPPLETTPAEEPFLAGA